MLSTSLFDLVVLELSELKDQVLLGQTDLNHVTESFAHPNSGKGWPVDHMSQT